MRNLLRADFNRIFKSKITIISLALAAVIPVLIAGLYLVLKKLMGEVDPDSGDLIGLLVNSHSLIATTFSFTNNFGIVMPIFAAIIVMADITSGTIRNKVILGYNRHKIFGSHFISALAYCLTIMTIYAAMTALWGVVFLGKVDMGADYARSLVFFYVLGLLEFIMVSAVAVCLSLITFSNVGAIMLTLVVCMGSGLLVSIIAIFATDKLEAIFRFIPGYSMLSFQAGKISVEEFWKGAVGTAVVTVLFYLLGTFVFNKKDIK